MALFVAYNDDFWGFCRNVRIGCRIKAYKKAAANHNRAFIFIDVDGIGFLDCVYYHGKKKLFFFGRGLYEYSDVLIWIDNIIIFHINKTQGQFLHYISQYYKISSFANAHTT